MDEEKYQWKCHTEVIDEIYHGTEEYLKRKIRMEIWEEFDAFISKFVEKHKLGKDARLELFRKLTEYTNK